MYSAIPLSNKIHCVILTLTLIFCLYVSGKPNYSLVFEGHKLKKGEHMDMVKFHTFRIVKLNRTAYVCNISSTLLMDWPENAQFKMNAYERLSSNRYSMVPVFLGHGPLCEMLEDKYIYPGIRKKSNFPEKCPILAGDYWMHNYMIEVDSLPPTLPGNHWRIDIDFVIDGVVRVAMSLFVSIERNG